MIGPSRRSIVSGLMLAAPGLAWAQPAPSLSAGLAPLQRFVGTWRGEAEGEPGKGKVERTYEPVLEGRFLHERNRSAYEPRKETPAGEIHHHVSYFSFDRARQRLVFRQLHQEGFVAQYVSASADFVDQVLVFDSEAIENIPAGWRARETYRFSGPDAFEEVFELAEPGKGFELYSRNRLRRA